MTDLQHAAEIHWRALNNQAVSQRELAFCLRFVFGNHKGSPTRRIPVDKLQDLMGTIFYRQEKAKTLIKQWQGTFHRPSAVSIQSAARFLFEIYSGLEETEVLFSGEIIPGATRQKRYTASDFNIRRPNAKLGWTLQLTTRGKGLYNCVRKSLTTEPGDLILLSPDAFYDYRRAQDCEMWEHLWIYFKQELHWFDLLQWPEVGPNIYHLSSTDKDYMKLRALFSEMISVHEKKPMFAEALTKNLLEQTLIRCRQLVPHSDIPAMDQRINRAKDYIIDNFNQPLTAETIATEVGLSPKQLSTYFRQKTGTTIKRWRDELRMGKASQLLTQTRQPINQIASIVGYSDSLYFSRCFRKYLNCSPREYRDRHAEVYSLVN